jgi:hypothetical protein
VTDPRIVDQVGVLRREEIAEEETHVRRVHPEVVIGPLHLPEEGFEEGGEGEEGEDGPFDGAERRGRGVEAGETEQEE